MGSPLDYRQGVPHTKTCRCGRPRGILANPGKTWAVLLCAHCDVSDGDPHAGPGQPPRFTEVRSLS